MIPARPYHGYEREPRTEEISAPTLRLGQVLLCRGGSLLLDHADTVLGCCHRTIGLRLSHDFVVPSGPQAPVDKPVASCEVLELRHRCPPVNGRVLYSGESALTSR